MAAVVIGVNWAIYIWAVNAESVYHEEQREDEHPYRNAPETKAMKEPVVRFLESDTNTKIVAKPQLRGAEGDRQVRPGQRGPLRRRPRGRYDVQAARGPLRADRGDRRRVRQT